MATIHHIALLVEASRAYGRGVCQGVATYAQDREDWLILPQMHVALRELPLWLRQSSISGIIAYIPTVELGEQLVSLGVPVVDVQGKGNCSAAPVFDTDPGLVASQAARFFLEAGFIHFGFCGYPGIFFSDRRSDAFIQIFKEKELPVHVYAPPLWDLSAGETAQRERGALEYEVELAHWLTRTPKPIAILACNDIRGQQIINACRDLGISMPDEVAVMGVDNDEIICRLSRPTLTSIAPDTEGIGRQAAEMLARMIAGETIEPGLRNVPPLRVVERQSTDITTAQHPTVLLATRIIRDRSCGGISVEQVCELVGCSRSTLDNLFRKHLGRPIAREVLRVRLGRSMRLMGDTQLPVEEIARRCGFLSATYFCRFFKRETGYSPIAFREQYRNR